MDLEIIQGLAQYGAVGLVAAFGIGFIAWHVRNTSKVLWEKDKVIQDINERRVEAAADYVKSVEKLTAQVQQLLQMIDRRAGP